jgi:sigma-E factor negative regulatory protein RseA
MSREALHESLSAVMDNEADELELRRVLSDSDAADVRATWSRYQIARAVMRKEQFMPHLDIAASVSAALADEQVVAPVKVARKAWSTLGRVAVAASVTLAVLAGVRLYNQDEITGAELAKEDAQPVISLPQQAQGPAMLAGYTQESTPIEAPADANVATQEQSGAAADSLPATDVDSVK